MQTYSITDLIGFAESLRTGAAESIVENSKENLDEFITIKQIINMIITKSLGQDSDGLYVIDEDIFDELFEQIRVNIYESGLAKLAAQDIIECAWDNDSNEMVFWTK